jgi:integrase
LTWEQMRAVLAKATRRDRLLLMLDMTDALRPSELFALRWRTFDDENTLYLTETVYREELSPFGKTPKSLGKMHRPDDLAELKLWKLECKKVRRRVYYPMPSCSQMQMAGSWTLLSIAAGF